MAPCGNHYCFCIRLNKWWLLQSSRIVTGKLLVPKHEPSRKSAILKPPTASYCAAVVGPGMGCPRHGQKQQSNRQVSHLVHRQEPMVSLHILYKIYNFSPDRNTTSCRAIAVSASSKALTTDMSLETLDPAILAGKLSYEPRPVPTY